MRNRIRAISLLALTTALLLLPLLSGCNDKPAEPQGGGYYKGPQQKVGAKKMKSGAGE